MGTKINDFITNYDQYKKNCNFNGPGVIVLKGQKENSKYIISSTKSVSRVLNTLRIDVKIGKKFAGNEDMHRLKIIELYSCPKEEINDLKERLIVKHDTIRNGHNNVMRPIRKGIKEHRPVNLEKLVAYEAGKKNSVHVMNNVFDNVKQITVTTKPTKKEKGFKDFRNKPLDVNESIKTIDTERKDLNKKINDLKHLESLLTKKADLLEEYLKAEKDYMDLCETSPAIRNERLS